MKTIKAVFVQLGILIVIGSCQKGVPPAVITTPVTEVTDHYAIAGGEVIDEGDSRVTARGICYTTDENVEPVIDNFGTITTNEGSGSGSFTGKIDAQWFGASHRYSKNHYFRAYATNKTGTSYGEALTFFPKLHPPCFGSLSIIDVTSTRAVIGYGTCYENKYDEFYICISTNSNPTIDDSHHSVQGSTFSGEDTLRNLVPNTVYHVRTYAKNESGSVYSPELSFTTWEGTIADIEGNIYPIKTIGSQVWMIKNLKTSKFNDGSVITNIADNLVWSSTETSAICTYIYSNHERLYNYYAVADNRNLCPSGWHVPDDNEWKILEVFEGMALVQTDATGFRGTDEGGKLKTPAPFYYWASPSVGATNSSGFSAIGSGFRYDNGIFTNTTISANYWTSTPYDPGSAWSRSLSYNSDQISRLSINKKYGFSIRCVKN